ncbi:unnamed protein product [Darwinula stevensoni]|uniref:Uncharacterized protein n=1 Tax=Darwinula stevensoni TaxID=69355 RepID=A0A7R8X779_9CRUS|nr:unnamed protein product [Darwinula stevensoni]CAG0886680.1 unnamed protein product [Darwinula stevensoni]
MDMESKQHFEKREVRHGGFGSRLKDSIYLGKKNKHKNDLETKKEPPKHSCDPLATGVSDETRETFNDIPDKNSEQVESRRLEDKGVASGGLRVKVMDSKDHAKDKEEPKKKKVSFTSSGPHGVEVTEEIAESFDEITDNNEIQMGSSPQVEEIAMRPWGLGLRATDSIVLTRKVKKEPIKPFRDPL